MHIAVDFDHTIAVTRYPAILREKWLAGAVLRWARRRGHKLILWTCRVDNYLTDAVLWCAVHNIAFDAVNENLPERIERFHGDCRKVSCDLLVDDRAGFIFWPYVALRIWWAEKREG